MNMQKSKIITRGDKKMRDEMITCIFEIFMRDIYKADEIKYQKNEINKKTRHKNRKR